MSSNIYRETLLFMYIEGPPHSAKTKNLVDAYLELVAKGENVSNILVVCSNAFRKKDFLYRVKSSIQGSYPYFNVYTSNGIIYNTVREYWPLIEERLKGDSIILPILSGLETCEFILKDSVKEQNKNDKLVLTFEDFYGDRSLISQLIRRYRLMVENDLSFDDLIKRSEFIGQENYSYPANESLKCLKLKTSKLKIIDFVTQMSIFKLLYTQEPKVLEHFNAYKHLLIDDYDELNPTIQHFIEKITPEMETVQITYDKSGGTRRGYLSAYHKGIETLKTIKPLKEKSLKSTSPLKSLAESLYDSINTQTPSTLQENISLTSTIQRIDMFDALTDTLDTLLIIEGNSLEDVVIVTPNVDTAIKTTIQDYCRKTNCQYQFLTGTDKPIDNPKVFGAVVILQLINPKWNLTPSPFDIRMMLTGILDFPPLVAEMVAEEYRKIYKDNPVLPNILLAEIKEEFNTAYQAFIKFISDLSNENNNVREQIIKIFSDIISPRLTCNDSVEDLNKVINSLDDFKKLIDQYKKVFGKDISERDWVLQIKNELIAENPVTPSDIEPNTLIIATPQKLVDLELTSKYQLWLEVSSWSWTRTQTAALYNAWAFSKYFDNNQYDDTRFTHNITAHVIRNLVYHCQRKIIAFSSTLDSMGREQEGWLINYLQNTSEHLTPTETIILRPDQQPVLDYKQGTMAVAAVPGAGKTFVNVALISKLITDGINPENILVLTYMESAAQTLITRIKTIFPNMVVLPQISTIHGLANRILRDENNLAKLGLSEDIEIADETVRPIIIDYITSATMPDYEKPDNWRKFVEFGIAKAKSQGIYPEDIRPHLNNRQELKAFYDAYKLYSKELKTRGLLDFDDLIAFSIKLLQSFPALKEKYQKKFRYIIEDEAQDSSKAQQTLLKLLSAHHNNYIRTGDVNQAIMTTFTPVDVEGFKKFITSANKPVEMNVSQRCAKQIYELANDLIRWANSKPDLKNAFFNIKMEPAEGRNPVSKNAVLLKIQPDSRQEMDFIAEKLKNQVESHPDATFAILVRTNKAAIDWTRHLDNHGLKPLCLTDNLQQKKVFNLIYDYLRTIHKPYNNKYILKLYNSLVEAEVIENDLETRAYLESLGSPFMAHTLMDLPTSQLVQFYMDVLYWLEYAALPPAELIMKITQETLTDPIDKSNGFILSVLADKFRQQENRNRYREDFNEWLDKPNSDGFIKSSVGLPDIIDLFGDKVRLKRVSSFKFFEKDEDEDARAGFVQVMTIHKAKGMGFDYVYVPHIWENAFAFATDPNLIRIDAVNKLEMQLMELTGNLNGLTIDEYAEKIKKNQVEENLRLLYVAITRAKRFLCLSSSYQNVDFRRSEKPSAFLKDYIETTSALTSGAEH